MLVSRIITVGISPAWDVKCTCRSVKWGQHVPIDKKTSTPAGKALNVSKALAWMKTQSIAAGLWGQDDYEQLRLRLKPFSDYLKEKMTAVPGSTRQNIWILDQSRLRDIHLRDKNHFITASALARLEKDLQNFVKNDDTLVFSGSMPTSAIKMIKNFSMKNVKIAMDTSGDALAMITKLKKIFVIKPNLLELKQLLNSDIKNTASSIVEHGRKLVGKIDNILVTRGEKGAILINKEGFWQAKPQNNKFETVGTVGCGDYFLAGFLAGLKKYTSHETALESAIIAGSGRAFGMDKSSFLSAKRKLDVKIIKL